MLGDGEEILVPSLSGRACRDNPAWEMPREEEEHTLWAFRFQATDTTPASHELVPWLVPTWPFHNPPLVSSVPRSSLSSLSSLSPGAWNRDQSKSSATARSLGKRVSPSPHQTGKKKGWDSTEKHPPPRYKESKTNFPLSSTFPRIITILLVQHPIKAQLRKLFQDACHLTRPLLDSAVIIVTGMYFSFHTRAHATSLPTRHWADLPLAMCLARDDGQCT